MRGSISTIAVETLVLSGWSNETTLEFPDYKGNNFYNTFGNIALDPRVGLQFIDFESGTLLNVQGRAEISTSQKDRSEQPDMGRRVRVQIEQTVRAEQAYPFRSDAVEFSPMLPSIPKDNHETPCD